MESVVQSRKLFQYIEKQRRGCAQKIRRLAGDDPAVFQFESCGRPARLLCAFQTLDRVFPVCDGDPGHIHEKFDLLSFLVRRITLQKSVQCGIIATDDFLT